MNASISACVSILSIGERLYIFVCILYGFVLLFIYSFIFLSVFGIGVYVLLPVALLILMYYTMNSCEIKI